MKPEIRVMFVVMNNMWTRVRSFLQTILELYGTDYKVSRIRSSFLRHKKPFIFSHFHFSVN